MLTNQDLPPEPCRDEAVKLEAVYIAARFSRRPEANLLARQLMARGHKVTSRWVKPDTDHVLPTGSSEQAADAERRRFAMEDCEDVHASDWMISLMEEPRSNGRGGRHIEFGMALGLGKRLTIIGPRETVFHHLDEVEQFETVEEFLAAPARTLPPSPVQDDDVERVVDAAREAARHTLNGSELARAVRLDDREDWRRFVRALLPALSTRPTTHTACFEQAGEGIAGAVGGEEVRDPAYDYAVSLLRTLHGKHFPKQAALQMLPDTLGVLTQIDNLTTALTKPAALPKEGEEKPEWRCFHCGDVFTSESCARLHFGPDEGATPACLIAGADGGLLRALREAEAAAGEAWNALHDETTDVHRAMYSASSRHYQALQSAEEKGYERGLRDARAEAALNPQPHDTDPQGGGQTPNETAASGKAQPMEGV